MTQVNDIHSVASNVRNMVTSKPDAGMGLPDDWLARPEGRMGRPDGWLMVPGGWSIGPEGSFGRADGWRGGLVGRAP